MGINEEDDDEIEMLTVEEFDHLKECVRKDAVALVLRDDDFILQADYRNPRETRPGVTVVQRLGKISIQRAISASVGFIVDDFTYNGVDPRDKLFAMAGRLREAARFCERKAEELNGRKWKDDVACTFIPLNDDEDDTFPDDDDDNEHDFRVNGSR